MSWEKVKLNDICSSIYDGDHNAPPKSDTGVPFVTISNIDAADGSIDFSNTAHVPNSYFESLKPERKPRPGDVLYSVVGSFGIPSLVKDQKPFVFQRHVAILRPNDRIEPEYLYYSMKSRNFYHWADSVAIGAAQRTVTLGQLREKTIALPPLPVQSRIAGVLSAHDKLIENNRKQIKLLEEAAQRLYKEWFVDLRFPGHETTPIHNGIPEGWKRTTVGEIASVNAKSLKASELPRMISYIDLSCASMGHILSVSQYSAQDAPGRARRVARDGSIAWGMVRPSQQSYCLVRHPSPSTVLSTGFAVIDAQAVPFSFLYETLAQNSFVSYLVGLTNGSTYPAVKPEHFYNAEVVTPDEKTLSRFDAAVLPILNGIELREQQIVAAREARDRLLPKLMSGEIEV
ncbi:MAG: restriction endonuclease subunit S [Coriobacteriia bacterium]|nr:restriction endonuclease subunit S [Coriobacteriia bacterium]